ncbi:carbohydrate ABC transporter permease [Kribbella sp. NBC_00382]|uniref:carbohydrate ABC transporter permease n=1 Tax=Kribbella sp. NBC_00382 TaxID=2975967 RepID=UPI002E20112C
MSGATGVVSTRPRATSARLSRLPRQIRKYVLAAVLWIFALGFIAPLVWMVSSSLKRNIDVFTAPMRWIPHPIQWANYAEVWLGDHSMLRYFGNSLLVTSVSVAGDLITSSMAGYAFALLTFRGRNKVFFIYLSTAIVPSQLLLVPRFMFFQQVGLYNTLFALILPGLFTLYGTFLLRQFFIATPTELAEAARLDGASEWGVFWRIYLPLARPMLAALGIIRFVGSWNDYETPLVMLSDDSRYTIPLGLTQFVDGDGGLSAGLAMAASVSSVLPILIVFLIFQRQFVAALAFTGLK